MESVKGSEPSWRPTRRVPTDLTALRAGLRQSRVPRWLLVVVLALTAGVGYGQVHRAAVAAEAAWRPTSPAWVVVEDLTAGAVIGPADVESRLLPAAMLPRDARTTSPIGLRLRDSVVRGEIIRTGRLSEAASGSLGAQLPPGTAGMRLTDPTPHLSVGDTVDLYALLGGERVAERARVLMIDEGTATVALPEIFVPDVVRALTTGDVVPVVVP